MSGFEELPYELASFIMLAQSSATSPEQMTAAGRALREAKLSSNSTVSTWIWHRRSNWLPLVLNFVGVVNVRLV